MRPQSRRYYFPKGARKVKLTRAALGFSAIQIVNLARRGGMFPSKRAIRRQLAKLKSG